MNYSRNFNDQLNDEENYDEYNRNNYLVNKIRFNNRYGTDNYNDTLKTNNNNNNYNINNNISMNYNNDNINNNNLNTNINNTNMNNNNINNMNSNNFGNNNVSRNGQNNMVKNSDINIDLNEYVREGLESRGLHIRTNSPRSIKQEEMERKKSLLNNIQTQINLTKRSKLDELKRRQEEDAQYLKDMVVCYPFGRGGGGAPNRDKSGNILTYRRALISDPKYNFASINVDDDYNKVWGREKRIGRFYTNNSEFSNSNNNIANNNSNSNNNDNNYCQTVPNTPSYNNNNFASSNYDNNNDFYNQSSSNNRPYSTNPRHNNNQDYNNNLINYSQTIPRRYEINVNTYNNDLYYKMKEEENRKLLELKQRELEQERENELILKEIEQIDKEQNEIKLRNSIREQNKLLRSYNNLNNNIERNNNETTIETNNIYRTNVIEQDVIDPDSVVLNKDDIDKINRSEQQSRKRLNDEISRLRDQMHNQQLSLFQQIANLRNEAEKANSQREEALKEIEKLKAQINQNNEDEMKKKYIHHIIITEDGNKGNETSTQTEPAQPNNDELNNLLKQNIDRLKYLEELEKLNIRRSPPVEPPKVIPEKEEEEDDDLYEIEITKIHN